MKRGFDLLAAAILTTLLSPFLLGIALSVRFFHGPPSIFRQKRPGLRGREFDILKFRTMNNNVDTDGNLLSDQERMTKFGALLRSTSLDELPELINVIKGEMSLVGPRPLLPRYMPYFTEKELKRFDVRPGITGLAQINGRNNASWNDRLAMDAWYVENMTLCLDLKILARTVRQILKRSDVVINPTSTMLDLDVERRQIEL